MTDKKTENQLFKKQKRTLTFHDDEFKRKVIAEYLDGNASKESIQKKYGIKADSAITRWMRKFGM
ncbi:MAG: transposase [Bacteroidetes bacterium]|nr:transposase [Bacteroidota bacterium]